MTTERKHVCSRRGGCHGAFEGEIYTPAQCRKCWLSLNDERYKAVADGKPVPLELLQPPTRAQQVWTFARAVAVWEKAGRPERSDEECKRIHSICESCLHFDKKNDKCGFCGCSLSRASSAGQWVRWALNVVDGIRMATHNCPTGRW